MKNQNYLFVLRVTYKALSLVAISVIAVFFFSSCSVNKMLFGNNHVGNLYSGTVYLKNGEGKTGRVQMPSPTSKFINIIETLNGAATQSNIPREEIDRVELFNSAAPDKIHVASYMTLNPTLGRKADRWVVLLAEGTYASAYVAADGYDIESDGSLKLIGNLQVTTGSSGQMIVVARESFPIYMMKKGEKKLKYVTLTKGMQFAGSSFRSAVSRFLSDDPELCEYIRDKKLEINNIGDIINSYNPNRVNGDLVINGSPYTPSKKGLFTNDLDNELCFYLESAIPSNKNYSAQFGLGVRSSAFKFFAYGADLGFGSVTYVDYQKRLDNHLINNMDNAPVIDADLSKQTMFRVNMFIGGQLPFDLKKVYLIPGANIALGGFVSSEVSSLYYGPMATLDLGFKLKYGSIFMIGLGYRRNITLKYDEGDVVSMPGFEPFKPYENLLIRLSYKF